MLPREARSLPADVLFLDVREPEEYEAGHISGAVHIPIGEIGRRWQEIPSDGRVVVTCQVGQRSGLVAGFLSERGIDAHNLEGGLEAWSEAGFPLESSREKARVIDGFARDLRGERISPNPDRQ